MTQASETRIAFLGLGIMGGGMAARLLGAGYPVAVYNRTATKADPLVAAGARLAATPAEAAKGADVIFSMLSDDSGSRDVWLGASGALAAADDGAILVECSTVTPAWVADLQSEAQKRHFELIDAPVTGSKPQAAAGQLLFLVGASETALAAITPLLQAMGRGIMHLGPVGSGARMKLINNFLSAVQAASLGEAFGLIERCGLNVDQALTVLTEGAPGSPMIKTLSARMASRSYQPNFAARLMAKDLRYAIELARSVSQDLPAATAALSDYEAAIAAGRGEEDIAVVAEHYRKR